MPSSFILKVVQTLLWMFRDAWFQYQAFWIVNKHSTKIYLKTNRVATSSKEEWTHCYKNYCWHRWQRWRGRTRLHRISTSKSSRSPAPTTSGPSLAHVHTILLHYCEEPSVSDKWKLYICHLIHKHTVSEFQKFEDYNQKLNKWCASHFVERSCVVTTMHSY